MVFGKGIDTFKPNLTLKTMDKRSIDLFFESLSKEVLKEKWQKYDTYSKQENNITVFQLLDIWKIYYENTFVYHKPDLLDSNNIIKGESEISFGLFC